MKPLVTDCTQHRSRRPLNSTLKRQRKYLTRSVIDQSNKQKSTRGEVLKLFKARGLLKAYSFKQTILAANLTVVTSAGTSLRHSANLCDVQGQWKSSVCHPSMTNTMWIHFHRELIYVLRGLFNNARAMSQQWVKACQIFLTAPSSSPWSLMDIIVSVNNVVLSIWEQQSTVSGKKKKKTCIPSHFYI